MRLVLSTLSFFLISLASCNNGLIQQVLPWDEKTYDVTPSIRSLQAETNALSLNYIEDFDSVVQQHQGYMQQVRGFFKAPQSGEYKFYSSCSGPCQIFLGQDPKAAPTKIINQKRESLHNEFNRYPDQVSHIIYLEKDKLYFLQGVEKQHGGLGHLSVGVVLPSDKKVFPISKPYLKTTGDLKRKGEILRSNGKDLTNQRDKMFTKLKEINDYIRRLTDAVKRNPITDEKKGKAKMENERLPKTGDEKNELATRENDKSSNEKTELENSKVVNGTDGKTQEELGLHEETVVTAESKEDKPINKKSNKQEEDNGNEEKNYSGNEKENDSGEERRYKTIMNAKLDENFLDGEETQASADEKKEEGRKEATVDGKQHEETNGMGESRDDARKIEKQSSGVNAKTGMKIVPKEDDKNRADDDSDDSSRRRKGQGESKTAEADKEGNVRKVKSETKNRKEKNDKESNAREEDGSSERQKGNRTREKNDGEVMKETMHNKANSKKDEKEERIVKGTEGNTLNVANAKGNIMASNLGINNLAPHQEALNTHAGEDLHGSNGNLVLEHNYIKVSKSSGHLDGLQTMNSYIDTSDNHNDLITNNHYHADRGNDDDDEEYVLQLTNYAKKQISSHGDLSEKALKNLIKVIKQRMLQDGFVKLQNATMVYKKSDEGENGKRISGNITRSEKPNESRRNKTKEMTSEMIGKGKINLYDKVVSNLMNAIKESTNDENEDSDKHNAIGDGKKESQIKADSSEENEQRKRMLSSLYLLSSEIENFKKVLRGAKKRDEGSVGGYKQTDRMEKGATKPSVEEMRFDNDVKKDEMKSTKNDENESKESEKKKSDNEEVNWGPDSARNDKNSHEKNENLESNVDKSISRESTQSRKDFQNAGDKKPKATTENNAKERKQTTRKSGDNKLINMEGGFKDITPKISFDENDENKTEPGDNESKEAFSKQLLVEGYANLVAGISDEGKVKSEKNGNSDEHNENAVDMSMNASKRNSYTDELAKTVEQYLKGVTVPGLLSDQANIDRRGNPTTEKELARSTAEKFSHLPAYGRQAASIKNVIGSKKTKIFKKLKMRRKYDRRGQIKHRV